MLRATILSAVILLSAVTLTASAANKPGMPVTAAAVSATSTPTSEAQDGYEVQPGDVLTVTVWKGNGSDGRPALGGAGLRPVIPARRRSGSARQDG